jgi:hypothetical protein
MKKFLSIILSSLLLLSFFVQCHHCHDTQLSSLSFTQDDLAINPYKDTDIFFFISSTHDTLRFLAERSTVNTLVQQNNTGPDLTITDNCRGEWYNTQVDFTGGFINSANLISIALGLPNLISGSPNVKTIAFSCWNYDQAVARFEGRFRFDKDTIMTLTGATKAGFVEGYLDSLTLGPNTYAHVYKLHIDQAYYTGTAYLDWVERIYYSISEGLVGYSLKSGKYYYSGK